MAELRIGLIGTNAVGRAHIDRINSMLHGGKVVACADPASQFGLSVAQILGLKGYADPFEMIRDPEIDALIDTTDEQSREQFVLAAISAGKYIFCESPLAPGADACRRIVDAETAGGKKLVQVGFMFRYDSGYRQLKYAIEARRYGEPLLLHCVHRSPGVPTPLAVANSMNQEIDVLRWMLGENYASVEVRLAKDTRRAHAMLSNPQIIILTTLSGVRIDVETFVSNSNNYDIKCEVVCEDAVLNLPAPADTTSANTSRDISIRKDWSARFVEACNAGLQSWIDAAKEGRVDGPTSWDAYLGQVTAAAAS